MGVANCIMAERDIWENFREDQLKLKLAELNERDDGSAEALRDAETAWLAYREAECLMRYLVWQRGTIRSILAAGCDLQLTARRAITLAKLGGRP